MEELKTQFVYKREIKVPPVKEDTENNIKAADGYTKVVEDSFNVELVIRTLTMDDGKLLLLLDDLHERMQEKVVMGKNGKPRKEKERDTFQSEIYLSKEEAEQYRKLTTINS